MDDFGANVLRKYTNNKFEKHYIKNLKKKIDISSKFKNHAY